MANESNLKPFSSVSVAREKGRKGGFAAAKSKQEKKTFKAMLEAIMDMPLEELENVNPRLAIVKGMILKAATGDTQAATWIRDTAGEKPVERTENENRDTVKVVLFGE